MGMNGHRSSFQGQSTISGAGAHHCQSKVVSVDLIYLRVSKVHPAHSRGLEPNDLSSPFWPKPFCDSRHPKPALPINTSPFLACCVQANPGSYLWDLLIENNSKGRNQKGGKSLVAFTYQYFSCQTALLLSCSKSGGGKQEIRENNLERDSDSDIYITYKDKA